MLRKIPIALLALLVPAIASAQKLTVLAVLHSVNERDYTVSTPQTTNTNCNLYPNSVDCNSTSGVARYFFPCRIIKLSISFAESRCPCLARNGLTSNRTLDVIARKTSNFSASVYDGASLSPVNLRPI